MAEQATIQRKQDASVQRAEHTRSGRVYSPPVDIAEVRDELLIYADMPGATPDSIDVNFENGVLAIHARVPERQREGTDYLLHEYGSGDFYRTFQVSESIDAQRISAEYNGGVLTIHLPKTEAVKPRRISVASK